MPHSTATFVDPASWSDATEYPLVPAHREQAGIGSGLHNAYKFSDRYARQLICCTFVAQYYMTRSFPLSKRPPAPGAAYGVSDFVSTC